MKDGPEPAASPINLNSLRSLFLSYSRDPDDSLIERAWHFADRAHQDQRRVSGEPYIHHPIEVAFILAEHRFDATTLAAALLHDVIEDCGVTEEELKQAFGEEIALIVSGVTKISSISEQTRREAAAENLRKMLVAIARDIRVLLIKLADRLHNMRTIGALDPARIERLSRETLEIYAPLANRMGMSTIRTELEDLGFRHLLPAKYREIEETLRFLVGERKKPLDEAVALLKERLAEAGLKAEVASRAKEIYSIYKKILRQNRPIEEIFDLLAMRVLLSNVRDCYHALGIVHTLWTPLPRRFKDYIAMPKPNMYQSLHTTVLGPDQSPLEIQIKTHEMHLTAEEGIAAHWKYKSDGSVDERFEWLRRLLDWQRESVSAEEFMDSLRINLYSDQVFIMTPKGDIVELPSGSTPIDVAYAIHTDLGNRIAGARVDGRMVPITSRLSSGAIVEILTTPGARPSRDWLDVVRTPRARQKIRHHLKERDAVELRRRGGELLQAALQRFETGLSVPQKSEPLVRLAEEGPYRTLDGLLEAIGFGSESAESVARRLLEKSRAESRPVERIPAPRPAVAMGASGPVVIEGMTDLVIRFGKCCNPVPGDEIVGYLSRGRGVAIHRVNCPNALALMGEAARIVKASWASAEGGFEAGITVESEDRIGLLADLTGAITREGGDIRSAEIRTKGGGRDLFVVLVRDGEHLNRLIRNLAAVDGVRRVSRSSPRV
jgi:GTP pyrophosphokinase